MKKTRVCFFILLSLSLCLIALYPKHIFLKIVEWKLESLIKKNLGAELKSSSLYLKSGKLYVKHAHLIAQNSFDITIEEAIFSYREGCLLKNVTAILQQGGTFSLDRFSRFLLDPSLRPTIENATIYLDTKKIECSFSEGVFYCAIDEQEPLSVNLHQVDQKTIEMHTSFSLRPLKEIFVCARYFLADLKSWECEKGEAAADITLKMQGKDCIGLKGGIELKNIVGEKHALKASLQHVSATFDKEKHDLVIEANHGAFGCIDLKEAALVLKENKMISSNILCTLFGLEGEIVLDSDFVWKMHFLGTCEKMTPFIPEKYRAAFIQAFQNDPFELNGFCAKNASGIDFEGFFLVSEHQIDFGGHYESGTPTSWFKGAHLPLEKFFSPFLFLDKNMHLSGRINCKGTFDKQILSFFYEGKNVILDTPHFTMQVPDQAQAVHYVDFKSESHSGTLPIKNGIYTQKTHGFTLENIEMKTCFSKDRIEMQEIATRFEDLAFSGDVTLARGKNRCLDLHIKTQKVEGPLSTAKHFLSKCVPSFHLPLELTGTMHSPKEGMSLRFLFEPGKKSHLVDATVEGSLSAHYLGTFLTCKDYKTSFHFDVKQNCLKFSKGFGKIEFPEGKTAYELLLPAFVVSDFPSPQFSVELQVKQGAHALFHLMGKTVAHAGRREITIASSQFNLKAIQEKDGIVIDPLNLNLKNFSFNATQHGFTIGADAIYRENPFHISIDSADQAFQRGVCTLKEKADSKEILKIDWRRDREIQIERIFGSSFGIEAFLQEKQKGMLHGSVHLNFTKFGAFLPAFLREKMESLKVGDGYRLEGDFAYNLREKNASFFGKLKGENFSLGGLRLGNLHADMVLSDHMIAIDNFQVIDWGGVLDIPKMHLSKHNALWSIVAPHIALHQVRLSRLRDPIVSGNHKNKKTYFKHLYIDSCVLNNVEGTFGDNSSFQGIGFLNFTNLSRKTFFSNLLFLPTEITRRIGLDLSLLVPAQGLIHFELGEGRINLTKFKGVYSEGKRSRFYLAEGYDPYIDFEGNLNLKVKMKQYNLLMKLAEFFVITVKGTLSKPSYIFTNQFDDELARFSED